MSKELNAAEGRLGRVVVVRLAPGTDLLKGIQAACERYQIHNGVVISATKRSAATDTEGSSPWMRPSNSPVRAA